MSSGTFGSNFAACTRRHESIVTSDPMTGRCAYWPESELHIFNNIMNKESKQWVEDFTLQW